MSVTLLGFEIALPVIALGVVTGLTYGLLAVGLVLVYRTSKVINFAHGEIGVFGASVFGLVVARYGMPYYLMFPLAILVAGGIGALSEVVVVRRLRKAPRLMSIVATLGIGQFLLIFSVVINSQARAGSSFPQPPLLPVFDIGALRITPAYSAMLIFTPLLVLALVLFLARSRFGLAIRGASANGELARMSGIFSSRMSSLSWGIAGAVSGFTAILFIPSLGFASGQIIGPGLLLRALAAAVVARMTSLPIALAAGIGVGVVEQSLLWNSPRGGLVEAALFVIILTALLLQRRTGGREEEKGSWAAVRAWQPLPVAYLQVRTIRLLPRTIGLVVLALVLVLPGVITHSVAITLVGLIAFGIVGLSVGIITGLGGQLSLGQFALAAIGATASYWVSSRTGNFILAFGYAGLAAALASLLIGLPALRIRGLMLTVTTLSFALATPAWLLQQPWMLGAGVDPGRPIIGDWAMTSGRAYYYLAVVAMLAMIWLARNVRRSGIGRKLVAVRDNEDNARAFTIGAAGVKIQGFMLAGFIAGIGGAVYGHALSNVGATAFPLDANINVVAMAVIGGIGVLIGPILGALYIIGIPAFLPLDSAGLAATSLGWLLLILYAPGGITQILEPLRDRLADRMARRAGLDVETIRAGEEQPAASMNIDMSEAVHHPAAAPALTTPVLGTTGADGGLHPKGIELLRVDDVRRHFGGVRAVDGVSFAVESGETLGLIGPNGAGKTTLFELIGGFTSVDSGRVLFEGMDITALGPEERAQLGLIRSFQDAALFPTMSVLETVQLSLEKLHPTPFFPSLLGFTGTERRREARARELVGFFGLDRYRDKAIQELSTGTRRITELACLVALQPRLLLLDEPSSGIAQRETEALGELLTDIKRQLDVTMVVIEHDIPLIMGLADRIVALDTGTKIAEGSPEAVKQHPRVVEAYLGGSVTAIERSGSTGSDGTPPEAAPASAAPSANGAGPHGGSANGVAVLAGIRGIGPGKQAALLTAFGSLDGLRAASVQEIAAVPGFGPSLARRVHDALRRDRTVARR
jgi:ABC-type branched-subunit amino acid transport system ATPase component/ABC-type branched-subunit amino acid transport system permease subunit